MRVRNSLKNRLFQRRGIQEPELTPETVILIAGSARSGTTWIADVVSGAVRGRLKFEPFVVGNHGKLAALEGEIDKEQADMNRSFFCHNSSQNDAIQQVLFGHYDNSWTDHQTPARKYEKRVVKSVRANLMIVKTAQLWPDLPVIYVLRNPLDVIESQLQKNKSNWGFDWSPGDVLDNSHLMTFLEEFEGTMRSTHDIIGRLALRWCVENYIPMCQNVNTNRNVLSVHYEDLLSNSEKEWGRIAQHVSSQEWKRYRHLLEVPSRTVSKSFGQKKQVTKRLLNSEHEREILEYVKSFGLEKLFNS